MPIDQRPTICEFLHGLTVGGAEVLADRMARSLHDQYRFVFGCLDEVGELGEALRADGFTVKHLNRKPGFDIGCRRRLRQLLRDEDVDVVHAHQYTPFFYALLARFTSRTPVLFTEHGRFHPDFPRRKRILFNRTMLRQTDRVVAVGEAVRQALIDNEGIPADRVGVIYNGIDLNAYLSVGDDKRQSTRSELGLGTDDFAIVQVARLDYLKDHLTAARIAERLAATGKPFRLLIVGEGPERCAIESEIESRNLGRFVTLLGMRQDVPRILGAADACLLTSISEGIPLTLIEAMAAGIPVVSTNVGGVSEVVLDGRTGLLTPAGDDQALSETLLRMIDNPAMRQELGEAGRRRAIDQFSDNTMHTAYANLFDEMLSRQAAPIPAGATA